MNKAPYEEEDIETVTVKYRWTVIQLVSILFTRIASPSAVHLLELLIKT